MCTILTGIIIIYISDTFIKELTHIAKNKMDVVEKLENTNEELKEKWRFKACGIKKEKKKKLRTNS